MPDQAPAPGSEVRIVEVLHGAEWAWWSEQVLADDTVLVTVQPHGTPLTFPAHPVPHPWGHLAAWQGTTVLKLRRAGDWYSVWKFFDADRAWRQSIVATPVPVEGVVPGHKLSTALRSEVVELLRSGLNPMQAARACGVSKSYIYNLHHSLGGVYRPPDVDYSARYLDREERYELARLLASGCSQRGAARRMGRSASTICRELARNRDPRTGEYQPERAHTMAWQRQRRPKASKIGPNPVLRDVVQGLLDRRFSPDQVAGRLKLIHPDNEQMHVSGESIYRSIYIYPRGEMARELRASLRSGRTTRRARGRRTSGSRIVGAVSITERPEEVEGRQVPGHHEGDLIIGSTSSNSAVATIVERTSGYLVLGHIAGGRKSEDVIDAVALAMSTYPSELAKTLTWDRGIEMANHADLTARTGIDVYFADPYKPWQRGSNENINGLLREYLPKSTDLSVHSPTDLQAIAGELNDRPRKRLGYYTPRERLATLIEEDLNRVATTD